MAIIYNRYKDSKDYTWYDSSNILFSLCYDLNTDTKILKLVFKNGRTYIYTVSVEDYIAFKNSESAGSGVNKYITKKYEAKRLSDTDLDELEILKQQMINEGKELTETPSANLAYHLAMNEKTGECTLSVNDNVVYSGVEAQHSILRLLKSLNIAYSFETNDDLHIVSSDKDLSDEEKESL